MKTDYVKTTVRLTGTQADRLKKRAAKSGVSMSEYIRSLLTKKALAVEPPDELWALLDTLYSLHAMLLRVNRPEFTEVAHRLEQNIVDLQAAFTAPRKAAS